MKGRIWPLGVLVVFVLGCIYGYAVAWHGVFPARQLHDLKRSLGGITSEERQAAQRIAAQQALVFPRDTVMVGDSLTAGADWDEMFPKVAPANRGATGDCIEDVLHRISGILALKPRRVFVMLGANDLARGDEPQAVLERYRELLRRFKPAGVVVQSVLPCDPSRKVGFMQVSCGEFNARAAAMNVALRMVSAQEGYTFVDLWPALSDARGLRPELSTDGLHLSVAGYLAWRDAILPLVEGVSPARTPAAPGA